MRTVNARTLTSSNVASFFTNEVKTYGGFFMIMTSTSLADIIVKQVRVHVPPRVPPFRAQLHLLAVRRRSARAACTP